MRTFFYFILTMVSLVGATSCSSDNNNNNSANDPAPVINTVTSGTWRITSFIEDGVNRTQYFTGFIFTFQSGGVLVASNGTETHTGAWSVTTDDQDDDSPSNSLDFNIIFTAPETFTEISEDWDIISRSANKISLRHVSGGDSSVDTLVFEKN
jgi:hypothetical protein